MANGDCYAANGREIIGADDSARLVHGVGILQTDGKPFGHCWVEKGGKCIDKSNGNNIKFPKQLYYFDLKLFMNYVYKNLIWDWEIPSNTKIL